MILLYMKYFGCAIASIINIIVLYKYHCNCNLSILLLLFSFKLGIDDGVIICNNCSHINHELLLYISIILDSRIPFFSWLIFASQNFVFKFYRRNTSLQIEKYFTTNWKFTTSNTACRNIILDQKNNNNNTSVVIVINCQ